MFPFDKSFRQSACIVIMTQLKHLNNKIYSHYNIHFDFLQKNKISAEWMCFSIPKHPSTKTRTKKKDQLHQNEINSHSHRCVTFSHVMFMIFNLLHFIIRTWMSIISVIFFFFVIFRIQKKILFWGSLDKTWTYRSYAVCAQCTTSYTFFFNDFSVKRNGKLSIFSKIVLMRTK